MSHRFGGEALEKLFKTRPFTLAIELTEVLVSITVTQEKR